MIEDVGMVKLECKRKRKVRKEIKEEIKKIVDSEGEEKRRIILVKIKDIEEVKNEGRGKSIDGERRDWIEENVMGEKIEGKIFKDRIKGWIGKENEIVIRNEILREVIGKSKNR